MWTIDVAGSGVGGAYRWRSLLEEYLETSRRQDIQIIGQTRQITGSWLGQRELLWTGAESNLSANNLCLTRGTHRVVLLRNALDFLTATEEAKLDIPLRRRVTTRCVRLLSSRSTTVVVPSLAMAERVMCAAPSLEDRLKVPLHPVAAPTTTRLDSIPTWLNALRDRPIIICPIVDGYHRLHSEWISSLVTGSGMVKDLILLITTERPKFIEESPSVKFVGRLVPTVLDAIYQLCTAIVYPTSIESFGYPMAEARVRGRPVLALPGLLAKEVAGPAHIECSFTRGDEVHRALKTALEHKVTPEVDAFSPSLYFSALLGQNI